MNVADMSKSSILDSLCEFLIPPVNVSSDACDMQKMVREIEKLSGTFSGSREYSQKKGTVNVFTKSEFT